MHSKRVLVTGATGFIGRPLVQALVRAGYSVRAATRRQALFPDGVEVAIVPDFRQPIHWDPILQGVDVVIHTAGHAHVDHTDDTHDPNDAINFVATRELARASARAGLERFILLSSVRAQCGASTPEIVREQQQAQPTDSYGQSKLAAEMSLQTAGVPFTILRPVVVYGRNPKGNFKLLVRLASSPLPLPFASFNNRRSVLGIDNLISAILFVSKNPATLGETYLVADPKAFSIAELLTMLRKAQGRQPRLFSLPPKLFESALLLANKRRIWQRLAGSLVVDTSKLELAGWRPVLETSAGLSAMLSTSDNVDANPDNL